MTDDLPQYLAPGTGAFKRAQDRRTCKLIQPPPYQSSAGLVLADRRSHVDRRAAWIREFSLEFSGA